ncbi:MAG: HNH endonuclease [Lachnospiraceae bacterium]|nr:HNH endonuclease [Lachnospiraceae bacterium]
MGDISNVTAQKFGIWVRATTGEYDFTKKYGNTREEAFERVHGELCKLVDAGAKDNYSAIRINLIAPIVRNKILAIYYPDKFLTIHSKRHLSYFCSKAEISYTDDDDELVLQRKLILWKEADSNMKEWSLLQFVAYLYEYFGKPPVENNGPAKKKNKLRDLKSELKKFDLHHPKAKLTEVEIKQRSTLVSNIVKIRAAGVCQLCNKPAPFYNKNGEAYLECHHIIWLAKGGADEINNAVALCPNCHKKMHILEDVHDIEYLINAVKE